MKHAPNTRITNPVGTKSTSRTNVSVNRRRITTTNASRTPAAQIAPPSRPNNEAPRTHNQTSAGSVTPVTISAPVPKLTSVIPDNVLSTTSTLGATPSSTNGQLLNNEAELLLANLEKTCIFCGEHNEAFTEAGFDLHYWKSCPMLKRCTNCRQVS
ncbi:unnamed protein product [Protopolystoma xenopodis]|uniref:Centrosomal protein CEP104 Zn finger domain-containing protein n=1 Tax=Protopolystoma xenopodis TaxID=117903 RepID=A0A448X3R0_9PLAT|nr:unnamed protein product [Protopolystoma xenopodis]